MSLCMFASDVPLAVWKLSFLLNLDLLHVYVHSDMTNGSWKRTYPTAIRWWILRDINQSCALVRTRNDFVVITTILMVPLKSDYD